jgi:ubiquinone biosynthesis protein
MAQIPTPRTGAERDASRGADVASVVDGARAAESAAGASAEVSPVPASVRRLAAARALPSTRPTSLSAKPGYRPVSASRYRFVRAYSTTFRVIASYLWLSFKGRLWGKAYKDQHLADVHRRNAKRVERHDRRAPRLFIKVGAAPQHHGELLARGVPLRARGAPGSGAAAPVLGDRARIEQELGKPRSRSSTRFDEEPIASASLGQVHEAARRTAARRGEGAAPRTSTRS